VFEVLAVVYVAGFDGRMKGKEVGREGFSKQA
jgi:hypothetical protein